MSETTCSSLLRWSKLRRSRMLFDESNEQLGKQLSFHLRSFFYFDDFLSITVRVKRYYTSYFHLLFFVWESLISFLNFVFISHAIRHQCKRHVLFPKGELFVFFNFFIFIASSVSFSMNEIDFIILRNKKFGEVSIWRTEVTHM